jgi:hypothetical protein
MYHGRNPEFFQLVSNHGKRVTGFFSLVLLKLNHSELCYISKYAIPANESVNKLGFY